MVFQDSNVAISPSISTGYFASSLSELLLVVVTGAAVVESLPITSPALKLKLKSVLKFTKDILTWVSFHHFSLGQ